MTCRVFGPPVRNEGGGLGVGELCFHGATAEQIIKTYYTGVELTRLY